MYCWVQIEDSYLPIIKYIVKFEAKNFRMILFPILSISLRRRQLKAFVFDGVDTYFGVVAFWPMLDCGFAL